MKRRVVYGAALFALVLALSPSLTRYVKAGVSCSLPFTLTNGTIADASQVMANYNALVTCLANAASAGNNSDITALLGLTTPIAVTQGGSTDWIGATSTGSPNSQSIATTPASFTLTTGYAVKFLPGATNTGPAQVNVNNTGLINVYRKTNLGVEVMAGGEIVAGSETRIVFDGTEFVQELSVSSSVIPVGMEGTFTGLGVPTGWLIENGQCVSQISYAALFNNYGNADIWSPGSTGGACPGGQFHLPFANGRVAAAYDGQGGIVAGVLTAAGSGCNAFNIAILCGGQAYTLVTNNLPAYTPAGAVAAPSHTDPFSNFGLSAAGADRLTFLANATGASGFGDVGSHSVGSNGVPGFTGTPQGGISQPFALIQPTYTVIKAVKY